MSITTTDEFGPSRKPVNSNSNLAAFATGPKNETELAAMAADVDARFKVFDRKLSGLQSELNTRAERIRADVGQYPELSQIQRQQIAEKEISRLRRELVKASDEDRYDDLRALKAADDQVIAVEAQFATPAHILARERLGSSERSRYLEQIANSGPQEIQNIARHSVATGNKVLGAALMTRLDQMPKRDRQLAGISRQELSEALAGEEHRNAQSAIAVVKNRTRAAIILNREFETGRKNARAKIGLALARRNEGGRQAAA